MVQATAASKDVNVHPSVLTFAREGNASPAEEAGAPPHQHRHLDSHSLFWDDLNQPKFLGLITAFYLGLRLVIYPTTLVGSSASHARHSLALNTDCWLQAATGDDAQPGCLTRYALRVCLSVCLCVLWWRCGE